MRRRDFLGLLGGAACAWPLRATAQSDTRVYRLGLLGLVNDKSPFEAPLVQGLARHGYEQSRNLVIERGPPERVTELNIGPGKVEAFIAVGFAAAQAVKRGTTLPAVAFSEGDPVATGLVDSVARPGGHITGITDVSVEVTPKRLELLKLLAPQLRKVAMLWNADDPAMTLRYRASEAGAKALGISVQALGVREPADFTQAFASMTSDPPDAILMVSDPLTNLNRKRVFEFAEAHRLPGIYEYDFITRDGGLMSYGLDLDESFGRVGDLVDRILKGAKPADLPFEEPTIFRFALNLKAAHAIGIEPATALLALADEVID